MVWWWLIAAIVTIFVASIAYDIINDWLQQHRTVSSSHAELIREKLDNGDYRVVAGVFDKRGTRTAQQSWEGSSLDDDLQRKFGNRDVIRVEF